MKNAVIYAFWDLFGILDPPFFWVTWNYVAIMPRWKLYMHKTTSCVLRISIIALCTGKTRHFCFSDLYDMSCELARLQISAFLMFLVRRAKNSVNNVSIRFVHFLDLTQKKHCKCFLFKEVQQCCKEHMCFGTLKATRPWEEQCLANFLIPVQALPRSGVNMFDFGFLNFNGRFHPSAGTVTPMELCTEFSLALANCPWTSVNWDLSPKIRYHIIVTALTPHKFCGLHA